MIRGAFVFFYIILSLLAISLFFLYPSFLVAASDEVCVVASPVYAYVCGIS